ncbi:nucleotide-binding protein [Methylobacter psychrophilus]|uniref:nucleotide-binding protein n=1 Tax=Methylobacter psychrophilus TaxID=96941 RepID=UPI0021D4ACF4|nr:nucleotide-binding protein [Methylobacter psychrophilus]
MKNASNEFTIFYSWQSDLPDSCNRQFIRQGLRNAANSIEESNSDYIIKVDEATRDASGSPNIPLMILSKIKTADMFVCDITTIFANPANTRQAPNPNVVFELGYAVAHLGWDRIVLLFNKDLGTFPGDMPFDFDRHRASPFSAKEKPSTKEKQELNKLLEDAISAVIRLNPERPTDQISPEKKKHVRDIENLKWILSTIHLPTLDQHLLNCPHMLQDKVLHFWEGFNTVAESSLFHLYDTELSKAFRSLHMSFHETTRHGEHYHKNFNGSAYIFSNPGDRPLSKKQQKDWDSIVSASNVMKTVLIQILNRVRKQFLEVDINNTNSAAWKEYVEFNLEQAKLLEEPDL